MSQNRGQVDAGANMVRQQQAGECLASMLRKATITVVGGAVLTGLACTSGVIERTGPVAAYNDTFPTAEQILAASPLNAGDSFSLLFRNTVAFALTAVAGVGIVLGTNVDIAASSTRKYLLTVLASGITSVFQAATTTASAVITGLTPAQAALVQPGMGVTGTGVPALATVLGVNSTTGAVTISAVTTATAVVGVTFFPRVLVEGVFSAAL